MIKQIFIVFLLCLLPLQAVSRSAGEDEMIRRIEDASAAIESLECSFVQTKSMKILDDRMVSEGKMYCSQPGRLRWEYTSPYSSIFIVNGDTVFLENEGRTDSVDVRKNRMYREMAGFMLGSVSGKCLSDEKSFHVSVTEDAGEWVVTLVPVKKSMLQMWTKLVLHFDPARNTVSGIEMHEQSGDLTVISFTDVKLNGDLDPGLFHLK